jgi:hypothetical protein
MFRKMLSSSRKKGEKIAAFTVAAIGIFLYVVNAATQGVIGSFTTDKLPKVVAFLTTTQVPLPVPLLLFVVALGAGYRFWQISKMKDKEIDSAADISDKLMRMYSTTFWFLQEMRDAKDNSIDELDRVTKKVVEYLLGYAAHMFNWAVYSGAFFALDGTVLKIWAHYRMSQADVEDKNLQFDLSQPVRLPAGMARASYENRTIEVGRIEEDEDGWKCTNRHYVKTGKLVGPIQSEPPRPPYSSLICIPVIYNSLKQSQNPKLLGVVSFYSHEKSAFDDPKINQLAEQIVKRIAEALEFYQYLKK